MIDWKFIAAREGGQVLRGYVPDSHSGVTVGVGVDLGYLSPGEFQALPMALRAKLEPYLGLRGAEANRELSERPLVLTQAEADQLEGPKRDSLIGALKRHYEAGSGISFDSIPDAAQTVLGSVTWQYGEPWARTPHFWVTCVRQDWRGAIAELRDFHDHFPTRRCLEADYLERGV